MIICNDPRNDDDKNVSGNSIQICESIKMYYCIDQPNLNIQNIELARSRTPVTRTARTEDLSGKTGQTEIEVTMYVKAGVAT